MAESLARTDAGAVAVADRPAAAGAPPGPLQVGSLKAALQQQRKAHIDRFRRQVAAQLGQLLDRQGRRAESVLSLLLDGIGDVAGSGQGRRGSRQGEQRQHRQHKLFHDNLGKNKTRDSGERRFPTSILVT